MEFLLVPRIDFHNLQFVVSNQQKHGLKHYVKIVKELKTPAKIIVFNSKFEEFDTDIPMIRKIKVPIEEKIPLESIAVFPGVFPRAISLVVQ